MRDAESSTASFKGVSNSQAPFKAQVTMWRLLWDRLLKRDNLTRRMTYVHMELECCCYKREIDTSSHFFFNCRAYGAKLLAGRGRVGRHLDQQINIESIFRHFLAKVIPKKTQRAVDVCDLGLV